MIVCLRSVVVPPEWRQRYLAWIDAGRQIRQQHGILAELVCEPADGTGETVVITVWPSHDVFDAWIATPHRDALTASEVHQAVTYRPIIRYDAPGAEFHHRPAPDSGGEWCTFETLIAAHDLAGDAALARLAKIVHAADVAADLDTDPLGPGLLAIGLGGLDVEADDQVLLERGMFVYDALYAWCAQQIATQPA